MAKKKRLPPWLDKNKNGIVDSKEKGAKKGESKSEDKSKGGKKKESMVDAMRKLPFERYKKGK